MNKLTQALMEELTVEYVKVGSLQIPESVVISWVPNIENVYERERATEILNEQSKELEEGAVERTSCLPAT